MRCVLVHAGRADARMWDPIVPWFAGHDPVSYDLRGHGQMDDAEEPWHHVDDLLDLIGDEPSVLVGAGTGARVTLEAAALRPELVLGLVLLGPLLGDGDGEQRCGPQVRELVDAMEGRTLAIRAAFTARESPRVADPLATVAGAAPAALVVAGEHGALDHARSVADALGVEVEVLPDVGALPSLEDPIAAGPLIERFLGGLG